MALTIVTNIPALTAARNLESTSRGLEQSIGRLSSGFRINQASDDAAGLGISENLKADIRSLAQARRNSFDAVSMSQMAEGALNEVQSIVTRMRELAVQSANGTLGNAERNYIQTEFEGLRSEINRISAVTEFNGQSLLDGSASSGISMQVGIQSSASDILHMSVARLVASTLGTTGGTSIGSVSLSTATNSQIGLTVFDDAITQLSSSRAKIGAFQNRINITITNLGAAHENLTAANARIRDVDVALESGEMTKNQILSQAGVALLGQANQLPATALSLIGQ
jgi:flagellin